MCLLPVYSLKYYCLILCILEFLVSELLWFFKTDNCGFQVEVERMRGRAHDKLMNKLAAARHKAEEKRAQAETKRNQQAAKTEQQADYIRRTGRIPSSFYCWNWCSWESLSISAVKAQVFLLNFGCWYILLQAYNVYTRACRKCPALAKSSLLDLINSWRSWKYFKYKYLNENNFPMYRPFVFLTISQELKLKVPPSLMGWNDIQGYWVHI